MSLVRLKCYNPTEGHLDIIVTGTNKTKYKHLLLGFLYSEESQKEAQGWRDNIYPRKHSWPL